MSCGNVVLALYMLPDLWLFSVLYRGQSYMFSCIISSISQSKWSGLFDADEWTAAQPK